MILLTLAMIAATSTGDGVSVSVSQTIVIRTHTVRGPVKPVPQPGYKEKKGPGCIDAAAIGGAAVAAPDAVDFILKGGQRMRARLEAECPALDYYRGFYVSPSPDGRICAGRDAIRTRSGGECMIDRFRKLVPVAAH